MTKGSSGGKRGGSAGGGATAEDSFKVSPDASEGFKKAANLSKSFIDSADLRNNETNKKITAFLNEADTMNRFLSKQNSKEATDIMKKAQTAALDYKIKRGFSSDSSVNLNDAGLKVRVGKGSFDIKDKLKESGFRFGEQGYRGWSKNYETPSSAQKDLKGLNLI